MCYRNSFGKIGGILVYFVKSGLDSTIAPRTAVGKSDPAHARILHQKRLWVEWERSKSTRQLYPEKRQRERWAIKGQCFDYLTERKPEEPDDSFKVV